MKKLILTLAVATTLISCNKADRYKSCQVDVYSSKFIESESKWSIDATELVLENVGFYRVFFNQTNGSGIMQEAVEYNLTLDPNDSDTYEESQDGLVLYRIDSDYTYQIFDDERPLQEDDYAYTPVYIEDIYDGIFERVTEFRVSCK